MLIETRIMISLHSSESKFCVNKLDFLIEYKYRNRSMVFNRTTTISNALTGGIISYIYHFSLILIIAVLVSFIFGKKSRTKTTNNEKSKGNKAKEIDSTDEGKKTISVYYKSFEQKIAFYKSTPQSSIEKMIKRLLKIDPNEDILYLDDEGIPLVFDLEAIPNGCKVYVQVEGEKQKLAIMNSKAVEWKWLPPSNTTHKLKNNDKTVYQPVNESMSWCLGDLIMEKGEYYYTLLFDPLMCCVYAGIEAPGFIMGDSEFIQSIDFSNRFLESIGKKGQYPGPQVTAGFYINMRTKTLIITNHESRNVIWKGNFTWNKVSPAVQFKHEVSITITSSSNQKPEWL